MLRRKGRWVSRCDDESCGLTTVTTTFGPDLEIVDRQGDLMCPTHQLLIAL
jgi:hypothetical protein